MVNWVGSEMGMHLGCRIKHLIRMLAEAPLAIIYVSDNKYVHLSSEDEIKRHFDIPVKDRNQRDFCTNI